MGELDTWMDAMAHDEKAFTLALGQRVAELRRQQGLTQAQLGELLEISQQKMAAIENGVRRLAVAELPALAKVLGASVEELLGEEEKKASKRGPASKLERHMEKIAQLPKARQRFVLEVLDSVMQQEGR